MEAGADSGCRQCLLRSHRPSQASTRFKQCTTERRRALGDSPRLARARESFELCSHFKSLPPVPDRELSADLTWRAHRRKPEFPALGSGTQSRCVQGDRGVKGCHRLENEMRRNRGEKKGDQFKFKCRKMVDYYAIRSIERTLNACVTA